MKLNLGCGMRKLEGYVNVDYDGEVKPDIVLDVCNTPYPWKDNSIDVIEAHHLLEYLYDRNNFFEECYRILKPDGELKITAYHYNSEEAYTDPDINFLVTPKYFQYLSRNSFTSDGRPIKNGSFDFSVKNMDFRMSNSAKSRWKTREQKEFAAKYMVDSIKEIDVTLVPHKPIRKIESDKPVCYKRI